MEASQEHEGNVSEAARTVAVPLCVLNCNITKLHYLRCIVVLLTAIRRNARSRFLVRLLALESRVKLSLVLGSFWSEQFLGCAIRQAVHVRRVER